MSNIVERLRSPANVFYEYAADNGAFLREAADEITRLRADLAAANTRMSKLDFERTAAELERDALRAELAAVTEERDMLRDVLKPFSDAASTDDYVDDIEIAETDTARKITFGDLRAARAALEGATKKEGGGMSDEGKCYAATPAATLEEHIINSNIAKSDTEWWAHHEITRLRADLAAVTAERDRMRAALKPCVDYFSWNGGLIRDEEYEAAAAALLETGDE